MPMQTFRAKNYDIALWPLSRVALVAAMGMIFGFDIGLFFIDQDFMSDYFLFIESQSDIILGTYILGFIFGVFIAGYVTYGSGRKISIISSVTVGSLGIFAAYVAPNISIRLCAEFVIGFSFGLYLIAANLYNCEVMPPNKRSLALMLTPCFIGAGALLSFSSLDSEHNHALISLAILFILTITLLCLSILKLPESPRYLALTGSTDAALSVLFMLRHDMGMAARELAEINECCRGETRGFEFYLQHTCYRRLLAFLCINTFLFNLGGLTIVPYLLMDNLSLNFICTEANLCYFSMSPWVIFFTFIFYFLSIICHTFAIERYKRRYVVLISTALATVFLVAAAISTVLPDNAIRPYALYFSFLGYILFGCGAFIIFCFVMVIELMPIRGREFGVAAVFLSFGIGCLFCIQTYNPIIHQFSFTGMLTLCVFADLFMLYLMYMLLPNTSAISLETIESQIMSASSFRHIVTKQESLKN